LPTTWSVLLLVATFPAETISRCKRHAKTE
jgi:hypothetical protein